MTNLSRLSSTLGLAVSLCIIAVFSGCDNTVPTDSPLPGAHGDQFGNPSSDGFHGKVLLASRYADMMNGGEGCARCHGTDFNGQGSDLSCNGSGCHVKAEGGPTACYTCHGDLLTKQVYPTNSPAHSTHISEGMACASCHTIPTVWTAPSHIDATPGPEVQMTDSLAALKTKGTTGTPTFVSSTVSCQNVYCHGNFTNGNNAVPQWKGTQQATCGTCHGDPSTGNPLPKGSHPPVETCSACHSGVVDANKNIIDKTKHGNGKLNVFGSERTDW